MKNSIRDIAFMVLFILIIFSCKKEPNTPSEWTNYNNENINFSSCMYPPDQPHI